MTLNHIARRDEIMRIAEERGITLDGFPAHVSGRMCKFPHVWTGKAPEGLRTVEFSWAAVERVAYGNGKFRS